MQSDKEAASLQRNSPDLLIWDCADQFARGFWVAGIENPVNAIAQLATSLQLPQLHVFEPEPNQEATSAPVWASKAGEGAGVIFDFALLSRLRSRATASILGSSEAALAPSSRLLSSAMTGLAYGGLLTPLSRGESQWHRLSNGITQAAGFAAFDGLSLGLKANFGAHTLFEVLGSNALAGFGAGLVHADVDSLTHGGGFASGKTMLSDGSAWAFGAALIGGLGYGLSKAGTAFAEKTSVENEAEMSSNSTTRGADAVVEASEADGKRATVTLQNFENGEQQVKQVELADGTRIVRQGNLDSWTINPQTPLEQKWDGDVLVNDGNELEFVYKYQKAPSQVSLDVRLPGGAKLARVDSQGMAQAPSTILNATNETTREAALKTIEALGLKINEDRIELQGVGATSTVNTRYSVNLTEAEAAQIETELNQSAEMSKSFKIVDGNYNLSGSAQSPAAAVDTGDGTAKTAENEAGEFKYAQPMADHTSTIAFLVPGDDGRWKVVTGPRLRPPFAGTEALPGGFLDMNGAQVEDPARTAMRELTEETGLQLKNATLVRIGDALGRDTRNRIIDFQYAAVGSPSDLTTLSANDDLASVHLSDVEDLLKNPDSLAFDHGQVLAAAYAKVRALSTEP